MGKGGQGGHCAGLAHLCCMSPCPLMSWLSGFSPEKRFLCPKSWGLFPPLTAMSQHTLVFWMVQTCPDPLVPGELLGTVLLQELSRGATRVGGTKPAEPALAVLCSSPAAFPAAQGWGHRSVRCHLPPSACHAWHSPSWENMSQGLVAMPAAGTAAMQHCMQSSAQQAGQARPGGETHPAPILLAATLLGFWTIYLIPKKGTVGPMDLSDFDIPAGGGKG